MWNHRPNLELHGDAVLPGAVGQAPGIVQHRLVRGYVNEQRREVGQVRIERRGQRIFWIGASQIETGGER